MLDCVKKLVFEKMSADKSGHSCDHVERVFTLAIKFAKQENADTNIVGLAALLHDVDDYKLVGAKNAEKLVGAKEIMKAAKIDKKTQSEVLEIIKNMGYKKALSGIRPKTLNGKIVSDADMCDSTGAHAIVRSVVYAVSDKASGVIFDRNVLPNLNIAHKEYTANGTAHDTDNAINHFFEKLLKLRDMMMTDSGKKESQKRYKIMTDFLQNFFEEENADDWLKLLKPWQ